MEAIILAAGRGQRMLGIAKPFYKPLLEINGLPLLAHSAMYAAAAGIEKITVVASPQNADDIENALAQCEIEVTLAIQNDPVGPGHAALVGLSRVRAERCMLLLSDNIMDQSAVISMISRCNSQKCDAVAVCDVNIAQASRFTRVRKNESGAYTYEETTPVTDDDIWDTDRATARVWCGPLVFNTIRAIDVLGHADTTNGELKIGPHLTQIMRAPTLLMDVHAMDVGIPSAYESAIQ